MICTFVTLLNILPFSLFQSLVLLLSSSSLVIIHLSAFALIALTKWYVDVDSVKISGFNLIEESYTNQFVDESIFFDKSYRYFPTLKTCSYTKFRLNLNTPWVRLIVFRF